MLVIDKQHGTYVGTDRVNDILYQVCGPTSPVVVNAMTVIYTVLGAIEGTSEEEGEIPKLIRGILRQAFVDEDNEAATRTEQELYWHILDTYPAISRRHLNMARQVRHFAFRRML